MGAPPARPFFLPRAGPRTNRQGVDPKGAGVALRAILFDKDGTLIDFDETWGPAAYEVMRSLAGADDQAFAELVRVSEDVLEERRFLPTSPLVAGSSAHYGPLWAQA